MLFVDKSLERFQMNLISAQTTTRLSIAFDVAIFHRMSFYLAMEGWTGYWKLHIRGTGEFRMKLQNVDIEIKTFDIQPEALSSWILNVAFVEKKCRV